VRLCYDNSAICTAVVAAAVGCGRGCHQKHDDRTPLLQQFRNLHGVQSSAFEQLIARNPKRESVI
jgi:hypothetical protein